MTVPTRTRAQPRTPIHRSARTARRCCATRGATCWASRRTGDVMSRLGPRSTSCVALNDGHTLSRYREGCMVVVKRYSAGTPLLVLSLLIGCDPSPVGPSTPVFRIAEAPSRTNAVAVSETRIDVSWQDNSSNETGFEVHRSTAGASGAFVLLASTGAGATTYGDAALTPAKQYCYMVRAFQ